MSRPLRVVVERLHEGEITLDPGAARYVTRVHRLAAGARFVVIDPARGLEADAELIGGRGRELVCRVERVRNAARAEARITLVQAFGKSDKIDQVVRDATALGVSALYVVDGSRSVPRLDERHVPARQARWAKVAAEAARQSGRGDVPVLEGPLSLGAALERAAAELGPKLVLHPEGKHGLEQALGGWRGKAPLWLAIGPEGGWAPGELEVLAASGFESVTLGAWVLRTETAAVAALGAIVARLTG